MKRLNEVAKELDVSMSWLEKYIKAGEIEVVWFGGVRRISDKEIERIKTEGIDIRQG